MRPILRQIGPLAWALAYAVIASAGVVACSLAEGTLLQEKAVRIGTNVLVQHPYVTNISTILDFAVLNPVAIYFLVKARRGFETAYTHFEVGRQLSRFDRIGLTAVAVMVGISTMWFYFRGFVGGTFFTEAFQPTPGGVAIVSWTGWAIFMATSLFIAMIALVAAEFGNYILFVRRLDAGRLHFSLPPKVSEDIEIAIAPCLNVAYVLAALFGVLAVFAVRDFLEFTIRESWRVWLFAPYIVACLVAFLPFWQLHKVMAQQRHDLIDANNRVLEKEIAVAGGDDRRSAKMRFDPAKLIMSVDKIEKMQSFYKSIPTWPTTANELIIPNVSVLVSVATLAYKTFDAIKASI
jgi:hypothetical protein